MSNKGKTVKDMKCGFCGVLGHTQKTCEDKKTKQKREEIKLRRKQAKKFYYVESKSLTNLTNKLTEEGKVALFNNGKLRSVHFVMQTKPETAVQESLIEPTIEQISKRAEEKGRRVEFSREPHFKTTDNRNKYLDYMLSVSFKGHKTPIKWLIEAEAPNQTHKGIEQVEDFLASVSNVNDYRFIVTDGYWWHFCLPTNDSALEWTSFTLDDSSFWYDNRISATVLDINMMDNAKTTLGMVAIFAAMILVGVF